jgi:hypothetical protein
MKREEIKTRKEIQRTITKCLSDTYKSSTPSLCCEVERYFLHCIKEITNHMYTNSEIKTRFCGDFEKYIVYITRKILYQFNDVKQCAIKKIIDETVKLYDIGIFDIFEDEIIIICNDLRRYLFDDRNWIPIINQLLIRLDSKYFKSTLYINKNGSFAV